MFVILCFLVPFAPKKLCSLLTVIYLHACLWISVCMYIYECVYTYKYSTASTKQRWQDDMTGSDKNEQQCKLIGKAQSQFLLVWDIIKHIFFYCIRMYLKNKTLEKTVKFIIALRFWISNGCKYIFLGPNFGAGIWVPRQGLQKQCALLEWWCWCNIPYCIRWDLV